MTRRTAMLFAFVLFLSLSGVPTLCAQTDTSPMQNGDATLRVCPVKTIESARVHLLLESSQWADFYLSQVKKIDRNWLSKKSGAIFSRQLEKTFTESPPSMNSLFDAVFGNCRIAWLNFNINAASLRPEPADPFVSLLGSFSDLETKRLISALLRTLGMVDQQSETGSVLAFSQGGLLIWFLDSFEDIPQLDGCNGVILGKEMKGMLQQREWLQAGKESTAANSNTGPCFFFELRSTGIDKIADYFRRLPSDSSLTSFAPGIVELARTTERFVCQMEEINEKTRITISFYCYEQETPRDLILLAERSRELLARWLREKEPSSGIRLAVTLLEQSELKAEGKRFDISWQTKDDTIFTLLCKALEDWSK